MLHGSPPLPPFLKSNVFIQENEYCLHESTCTIRMEIKKKMIYTKKKNVVCIKNFIIAILHDN